jgi:TonB family protein
MVYIPNKLLRIGVLNEADRERVDERLIHVPMDITLGTASSNTFVVKGAKAPRSRKVFELNADGTYTLLFDRDSSGKVDLGGEPQDLAALSTSPQVERRGGKLALTLPMTVRGRVAVDGYILLFQFVDAPKPLLGSVGPMPGVRASIAAQIDWPFAYVMAVAFLLLGGTTSVVEYWWNETGQYFFQPLAEGKSKLYELVRAEVVKAEEKKEEPEKDKEDEEKAKEEAEKAAKEAEEQAKEPAPAPEKEKPKAAQVKKAAQARAVSTAGGRAKDRAAVVAAVKKKTFLHVLGSAGGSGAGGRNTLGAGANSAAIADAFNTAGGITDSGVAAVGGVDSGPSAVAGGEGGGRYRGISASEAGGGTIRTGPVTTGGKGPEETKLNLRIGGSLSGQSGSGKIDGAVVTSVFSRRKGAIKSCYEAALKVNASLKGKVTIKFTIGPAGRITDISVTDNSTGDAGIGSCIVDKVRGWKFDPPEGGSVTFSYPFLLSQ